MWIDKPRVLVLHRFGPVWLCATLWTVACQGPLSVGSSRQEYWSGLPCLPPGDLPQINFILYQIKHSRNKKTFHVTDVHLLVLWFTCLPTFSFDFLLYRLVSTWGMLKHRHSLRVTSHYFIISSLQFTLWFCIYSWCSKQHSLHHSLLAFSSCH